MDVSTITNNVIKNISMIPGILGFCNIEKTNQEIKDSKLWSKAVLLVINDEIVNLNIAIIISVDSTITNISKQIKKQLTFNFKKSGFKLGNVNIYIKGVR